MSSSGQSKGTGRSKTATEYPSTSMQHKKLGTIDPSTLSIGGVSVSINDSIRTEKKSKKGSKRPVCRVKKPAKKSAPEVDDDDGNAEFDIAVIERDTPARYGIGKWRPDCLQFFGREPLALLFVLCILSTAVTYIHYGVVPAASSQLQLRYHITPTAFAVIRFMFELGALIMLLPVLYYDGDGIHRARWIGIGGLVVGFGGVIMILPQGIANLMTGGSSSTLEEMPDYCRRDAGHPEYESRCNEPFKAYMFLFMLGEFLVGVGMVPTYVIGITYLDENVTQHQSAIYTAVLQTCRLLGPMLSFVITSASMRLQPWHRRHHDHSHKEDVEHHHEHDEENGAWWISMSFGVLLSCIGAAMIMPYPRQLSGAAVARIRDARNATMANREGDADPEIDHHHVLRKIKRVISNPVFIGSIVDQSFMLFMVSGFISFLGKYIETMFNITATQSSVLVGFAIILTALVGLCFGTLLQHLFRLEVYGNLCLCMASAVGTLLFVNVFLVNCAADKVIAGVTVAYPNVSRFNITPTKAFKISNECNRDCNCDDDHFHPICFVPSKLSVYKKTTYYSSCHAGCRARVKMHQSSVSSDLCECVPINGTVKYGQCVQCSSKYMYAFLLGLAWFGVSIYVRENPRQQLILRAVSFRLRTVAIALSHFSVRLVASPGALLFAWIMDATCVHKAVHCDTHNQCVIHDRKKLSHGIHYTGLAICSVCLLALIIAWWIFKKKPGNVYERLPVKMPTSSKQARASSNPTNGKQSKSMPTSAKQSKSGLKLA